jgi:hypothetical protein
MTKLELPFITDTQYWDLFLVETGYNPALGYWCEGVDVGIGHLEVSINQPSAKEVCISITYSVNENDLHLSHIEDHWFYGEVPSYNLLKKEYELLLSRVLHNFNSYLAGISLDMWKVSNARQ